MEAFEQKGHTVIIKSVQESYAIKRPFNFWFWSFSSNVFHELKLCPAYEPHLVLDCVRNMKSSVYDEVLIPSFEVRERSDASFIGVKDDLRLHFIMTESIQITTCLWIRLQMSNSAPLSPWRWQQHNPALPFFSRLSTTRPPASSLFPQRSWRHT